MVDLLGLAEWVFTPKLLNEILDKLGIDIELPDIWELAFAICQTIAAMLAPFMIYIGLIALVCILAYKSPDIFKPLIHYLNYKMIELFGGDEHIDKIFK